MTAATAFKIEALSDDRLEGKGPGRRGNFVLTEFEVEEAGQKDVPKGRYVRVELPGKEKILHFAELEVLSRGKNLALKKPVRQSSEDFAGKASRGNDGNPDGEYERGSVTHTKTENNPWWEVDLGQMQEIEELVFWNRTGAGGLRTRADGLVLSVLDDRRKEVFRHQFKQAPEKNGKVALSNVQRVEVAQVWSSFDQTHFGIAKAIDGDLKKDSGWAIAPKMGQSHEAVFVMAKPLKSSEVVIKLKQNYPDHALGKFRILVTESLPLSPEFRRCSRFRRGSGMPR